MSTYRTDLAEAHPGVGFDAIPDSRFTTLGALSGFEVRGNTLLLDADEARLAVTFLAHDVVRVRLAPDRDFGTDRDGNPDDGTGEPFSYAVEPNDRFTFGDLAVDDLGAELRVETEALTLRVHKRPLRLAFHDADGRLLLRDTAGAAFARPDADTGEAPAADYQVRTWKHLPADAHFFGLGDKAFPLDRRGRRYVCWNSDTYAYGVGQDPIYKSIPFLIGLHDGGRSCYGLFFDNTYKSAFDLGADDPGRFWFGAEGGELRYYVFAGHSGSAAHAPGDGPKHVLRRYCDLTGHKPMPPKWSLGYHQSRWNYQDDGYALWIAHEFQRRDIPLECVHLDIAYMDGYRVFTFDDQRFPDPQQFNRHMEELGVKTVVIVDPGVKIDDAYDVYREGAERGFFNRNADGSYFTGNVWPGDVHWPDYSNAAAREWWGALHQRYLDAGITGFWNDMNEPAILGGLTFPDDVQFDWDGRGTTHAEGHNVYGMLMAKATFDGLRQLRPDERPFLLTRACFSGSQRYAAAWTGDNVSSWEHLLLSLQICQSLSASGLAFCGPDIGGFAGQPSPELYARWMQAGVFLPFMRTHYSHEEIDQQEPWSFGEEVEAICRRYIGLRYELMPYLYTAFVACCASAEPPMKALFLEHPTDARTYGADDTFYFGPSLLVAPVVQEGATGRDVYFPAGRYYDFWTGEPIEGPRSVYREAPLDTLPLFARAGHVVAMQARVRSTAAPTPETLVLRAFPGDGRSEAYFDDGRSYAHEGGEYLRLCFEMADTDGALEIRLHREGDGDLPHRTLEWQVPTTGLDGRQWVVQVDGRALPVFNGPRPFGEAEEGALVDRDCLRIRTRTDLNRLTIR